MNLRLRTLLAGTALSFAALSAGAALSILSLARDGETHARYLVDSVRSVACAERIALELHQLTHAGDPAAERAAVELPRDIATARALIQSQTEEAIVARLEESARALLALPPAGPGLDPERERALARASAAQDELLGINLEQAAGAEARMTSRGRRASRQAALVSGALIAAMGALLLLLRAHLLRPLAALRSDLQRLALGEVGVRAPERRTVELGELADTFNAMAALLDEQRRGRAEILGRVAAALEAPLSGLHAQLERLTPGAPPLDAEELRQLHAQLVRQSLQLEQGVAGFLDAARAETGELELTRGPCDLRELARESVELFRGLSPAHAIALDAPAPLPLVADGARLSQVINALLALALRRAQGSGSLEVRARESGGMGELSISAAAGEVTQSFEALFNDLRSLGDALAGVPGVLFGLTTSRKLVEGHGGRIEVDARGTRFLVVLPLARSDRPALATTPAGEPLAAPL